MSEIYRLTDRLSKLVDFSCDHLDEFSLTEIRDELAELIEQETFWINNENIPRYHYDLKKFVSWLEGYSQEISGHNYADWNSSRDDNF
jgi:hypothetical protein